MGRLRKTLHNLRLVGSLDSTGCFTLEQSRALEKMAQFRLPEPHLCVLNLVASAIASGARTVNITATVREFRLEHDGRAPSRTDLGQLFSVLTVRDCPTSYSELAIGVQAAQSLRPVFTGVTCWDDEGAYQVFFGLDGTEVVPAKAPRKPSRTVLVEIRKGRLETLFGSLFAGMPPWVTPLWMYGRRAPALITVNGKRLNARAAFQFCDALAVVVGSALEESQLLQNIAVGSETEIGVRLSTIRPFSGVVGLARKGSPRWPTGLEVVVHGVSFRLPAQVLGSPRACGLVYAPSLRKDLSQMGLVEDKAYSEMLTLLGAALSKLGRSDKRAPGFWRGVRDWLIPA